MTKGYVITVTAETEERAKRIVEFYTGDIHDLSTDEDRKEFNFSIAEIDCKINESWKAEEI
ncbi:MAG: hypothetical protein ABIK20_00275 [Candidatus Omnitrophota bacterium]|nr:hypothetical protein [Candidatus Omnitrophota bacterium]